MNVQEIIQQAMNSAEGRAVSSLQLSDSFGSADIQKLAAALNFIGANLEDSELSPLETIAEAELLKEAVRKAKKDTSFFGRQRQAKLDAAQEPLRTAFTVDATGNVVPPNAPRTAPSPTARSPIIVDPAGQATLPPSRSGVAPRPEYTVPDSRPAPAPRPKQAPRQKAPRPQYPSPVRNVIQPRVEIPQPRADVVRPNISPVAPAAPTAIPPSAPKAPNPTIEAFKARRDAAAAAHLAAEQAEREALARKFGPPSNTIDPVGNFGPAPSSGAPTATSGGAPRATSGGAPRATSGGAPVAPTQAPMHSRVLEHLKRNKGRYAAGAVGAAALGAGAYMYAKRKQQDKAAAYGLVGLAGGAVGGAAGHDVARRKLEAAGINPDSVDLSGALGGAGRGVGYAVGSGLLGGITGQMGTENGQLVGTPLGHLMALGGTGYGIYRGYRAPIEQAERAIRGVQGTQKKTAGFGKFAEDAINPARISAGPAPAFSGEVMPASSPVFGGSMSASELVALKAQKVRDRINSDMRQYVSEVGDGYGLDGHLSIFNK